MLAHYSLQFVGVAMFVVQVSFMHREIVWEKKVKWNLFITDTISILEIVLVIKVSSIQRLSNVPINVMPRYP